MRDDQAAAGEPENERERPGITRRALLQGAGQAGLALTAGGLIAACGSSSSTSSATASHAATGKGLTALPGGTPKRGGTLRVGTLSGGQAENLFPGTTVVNADLMRVFNLYSLLFYAGPNISPLEPGLALSAEPNKAGTLWTLKLRDNVTWHDGKPFSADDVVYNFQALWSQSTNAGYGLLVNLVDFKGVRKRDRLTVEVPLHRGCAALPEVLAWFPFGVMQNGATQKTTGIRPIGTGPFKYKSFAPGSSSTFTAFSDYWESGLPYVDELVVNSSFTQNSAINNALLGGEIDLQPGLPLVTARQQLAAKQMQILESAVWATQSLFIMRVDKGQFADNRVREAFKLFPDRQALVDSAYSGFGGPANDLLAPGTDYFLSDVKRTRDVEKAKSLLKAAGMADAKFVLPTTTAFAGMLESATVLAAQAQQAGINVQVKQVSASTYFTEAAGYKTRPFGQDYNLSVAALAVDYLAELTTGCPYPDTHWGSQPGGAAAQELISQAIAATDPTKAKQLWSEAQMQQYNEGGSLIFANVPNVDAAANNVRGLKAGANFNFNNWRYCDGWVD